MRSDLPDFGTVSIDPSWKITIIRSIWYDDLTMMMVTTASEELTKRGLPAANITVIDAPGSYELPILAKVALENGADGVIAFGIVVQGATHHAALVAEQSAAGCMQVQLSLGKPVTFEVLYVDTLDDARSRVTGKDAKGPLAAITLLSCLAKIGEMRS